MAAAPADGGARVVAVDWMRGLVMILMTLDHASEFFNSGRFRGDSAYLVPLQEASTSALQFLTRNVTHLCAPSFVFLAGLSIALSVAKREARAQRTVVIDAHLVGRALTLFGCEAFLSLLAPGHHVLLQVLWAIGFAILASVLTRRLSISMQVALATLWLVGSEALTLQLCPPGAEPSTPALMFLVPGHQGAVMSLYPALPWVAIFVLGQAFGRWSIEARRHEPARVARRLLHFAALGFVVFVVVRFVDGYGNMGLYRGDDGQQGGLASALRWLHVSKYPPSLSFVALELGLMALLLALFEGLALRRAVRVREHGLLLVLGRTALFYYMLHFIVLGAALAVAGLEEGSLGLGASYALAITCVLLLYPLCRAYLAFERRTRGARAG